MACGTLDVHQFFFYPGKQEGMLKNIRCNPRAYEDDALPRED